MMVRVLAAMTAFMVLSVLPQCVLADGIYIDVRPGNIKEVAPWLTVTVKGCWRDDGGH